MKTMNYSMKVLLGLILIAVTHSCGSEVHTNEEVPTQKEINRGMEDINRKFALDEAVQIDGYIERHEWDMKATGTGLRYMIYENGSGEQVGKEWKVEIDYHVSLLDGSDLYSSEESGPRIVTVGRDNIETGLHEGLLLLHVGDRAKFILPSHLAHGLTGDNSKIPPRSSVVYDIQLLAGHP
ncbi:MAG TPA: peptidylprolyl isomerase [Flavobacteriales bacterium]|nr:peptidylprolyl isomerase [Flavobacteriales bacterium]